MKKHGALRISGALLVIAGLTLLGPAWEMMQEALKSVVGTESPLSGELFLHVLFLIGMVSLLLALALLDVGIGIGVMRSKRWAVWAAIPMSCLGLLVFKLNVANLLFWVHLLTFGCLTLWGLRFLKDQSEGMRES